MLKQPGVFFKRIGFFMPFTWYFILFSLILYFGFRYLKLRSELPESAYRDVFTLLLKVVLFFSMAFLLFGCITAGISFIFLKLKQRKNSISVTVVTEQKPEGSATQRVQVRISPLIKPVMGFIKLRINYDANNYSNKFSLVSASSGKLFEKSLDGVYEWQLPEIREYRVEKILLYFEDMFQFFSFVVSLDTDKSFYTAASRQSINPIKASPRKTEESTTRIEELKKVEGEFLNYKNFESNDDVRRIVWKIYARNKELVVRIPEIVDPYASHVYLYASFCNGIKTSFTELTDVPMLSFYKNMCWSVYTQLKAKGLNVRFKSDAEIPTGNAIENEDERVRYGISVAKWQSQSSLKDFVKTSDASVLVVSSLSDPIELNDILERSSGGLTVVFIPLSETFERNGIFSWLKWLFIEEEKDQTSVFRSKWNLSFQKPVILKNEKKLSKLLSEYQGSVVAKINE